MEIIKNVQVGANMITKPLRVVTSQPIQLEGFAPPEAGVLGATVKTVASGFSGKLAWHGFQVTNTTGQDEIVKLLVKNGLAPEHAPGVAEKAVEVMRAEPTKIVLVAVSAGGTAWAILEAGSKLLGLKLSWVKKALISLTVAVIAGFGYHYLRTRGYLQ